MAAYEVADPVVQAVCTGNRGALLKLINRGKSVNQPCRNTDGDLVPLLCLAATGREPGHLAVAGLLLDRGKYKHGYLHTRSVIPEHLCSCTGSGVDTAAGNGCTALLSSCCEGNLQMTQLLLDRGAAVNFASPDGATPL